MSPAKALIIVSTSARGLVGNKSCPAYQRIKRYKVLGRKVQQGVTLLELLIVVAIIAVMGLVAGPQIIETWLPNQHLRSAAKELYGNMQKAKMGAIKNNQPWAILFTPATQSYVVCENYTSTNTGCGDDAGENVKMTVTLSSYGSGVKFRPQVGAGSATTNATSGGGSFPMDGVSFAGNRLTFGANGMPIALGYVYLTNNRNTDYAIGVITLAGMIEIKKWVSTSWQ